MTILEELELAREEKLYLEESLGFSPTNTSCEECGTFTDTYLDHYGLYTCHKCDKRIY